MSGTDQRISVSDAGDVTLAERKAKAIVGETRFTDSAVDEIAIVVRELSSNIVKHAGEGTITVTPRDSDGRSGIEIRAEDLGPGIDDVDRALEDGYSTAGSLGYGLGAVHRLMDDVVIESNEHGETGVQISATRRRSDASPRAVQNPITAGAATRAKPGQEHNGDAFIIKRGKESMLVGVIDGLGHGKSAHRASQQAHRYIKTHASQPLSRLFRGVERACRNTRGVVMALGRFDFASERVTAGSVGNVSVKIFDSPEPMNVVARRGVLGNDAPQPAIREWEWNRNYTFVMHSDGIATGWSRDEFAQLADASATNAARELLQSLAEERDDATVLVVKEADA